MKLQVMSDLHLEFYKGGAAEEFISQLPVCADILVLAGDVLPNDRLELLDQFFERWEHVIYTPGNHEYYGKRNHNYVWANLLRPEVLLRGGWYCVDGQRFVGGTMWFGQHPDTNQYDEFCMNDFAHIPGFRSWVYDHNTHFDKWLRCELESDDIVITHHLPSHRSVHPRYKASRLNRFFVHDMEDLIMERQPKLWIHGHTHERCDYMIGRTRVVANPKGYPHELTRFDPTLVIEV